MKRFSTLISFLFLVSFAFIMEAMDYTKKQCDCCGGRRGYFTGYFDYYGNPIWMPCQCCQGMGYVLVPINNSPSFPGNGVCRPVSLRSEYGGKVHATGTFYEGQMKVVSGGVHLKVSPSDSHKWKYMIRFDKGPSWYFD